jgi:hypothetical protein
MFQSWYRRQVRRIPQSSLRRGRRLRAPLQLESLEDRCLMTGNVTIGSVLLPGFGLPQATEGQLGSSLSANFTDTAGVAADQLTAVIDYGDGTTAAMGTITKTGATSYTVLDNHTFPEESGSVVPPFAFNVTLLVFENNNPAANTDTAHGQAQVLDAPLSPGNPVSAGTPQIFTGGDTGNPVSTAQALANFKAAIGGVDNGGVGTPQSNGFRTINWDGVKLDGTDFGGGPNTTVIDPGKTVAIPLDRFQERGVFFGAVYAVSGPASPTDPSTFADVNPNVEGLFPSFSPHNTFAMMNDNGIDFKFVVPSSHTTALVSASSRGFGAVFQNVELADTTTIEYFNGSTSLGSFAVKPGAKGQSEFLGVLFDNPIVTNVVLTLGTDVIFKFDGSTFSSSGVADDPATGHNLVTVDDWAYAEPQAIPNGFPIVSGAAGTNNAAVSNSTHVGTAFTGVVATFSDADPNANAKDFTATINWGDGHLTNGTVTANAAGGFDVSGTNTYAKAGKFPINVDIADFGGGPGAAGSQPTLSVNNTIQVLQESTFTTLTTSPSSTIFGQPVTLTATVSPTPGTGVPTGTVTFFDGGTPLGTVALNSAGQATFTTTSLAPGAHGLSAFYNGDANFVASAGAAIQNVSFDVTPLFNVSLGGIKFKSGHFHRRLRLQNLSGSSIPGPVLLALDGLGAGVKVRGAVGVTSVLPPLGSPLLMLDLQGASVFAPGFTVTVDLVFSGASPGKLAHLTPRLLAGTFMV